MNKRKLYRHLIFIFLITVCLLCSCTQELPDHSDKESTDVIDRTLFTHSEALLYKARSRVFRNLPGQVLFTTNQMELHYVNKNTGVAHSFCYDPLCDGESCLAHTNPFARHYIWCPADDCLYATQLDPYTMGNDGNLYRIDLFTQEQEMVLLGNGNEIRSIGANDSYLFLLRYKQDGGFELVRYDPIHEEQTIIQAPDGKDFFEVCVSGDTLLVTFQDEPYAYWTDSSCHNYQKTELTDVVYMDQVLIYLLTDNTDQSVGLTNAARHLDRYNLLTGETTRLLSVAHTVLEPVGFDGKYVYYILNPLNPIEPTQVLSHGTLLYRVPIIGGESEPLVDFGKEHTELPYDLYVYEVCCYDGVIYCNVKSDKSDNSVDDFGIITQGDDGVWVYRSVEIED